MTKKIMKDQQIDMLQFYREQSITQSEQLTAQVKQLTDDQVVYRRFHDALNETLYVLRDMQCIHHAHEFEIPF